jgi:hypothetical protein
MNENEILNQTNDIENKYFFSPFFKVHFGDLLLVRISKVLNNIILTISQVSMHHMPEQKDRI